jgi:Domain of unknown function (DUF4114)/Lipase (class 3)
MTISPVQTIHPIYELFAKGIYSYFGGGQTAVIDQLRSAGYTIDKEFNDPTTSFQALGLIYKDGTRPPVLVFQGTVDNKDFIEDSNPQGVGFNQFTVNKNAVKSWLTSVIADKTKNPSGLKVDFTGHSLGAALTQWFASEFPNQLGEAVTFQSPGITQAAIDGFVSKGGTASQITHYAVNGDIVSLAGVAFLPGTLRLADYQTATNDPDKYFTKHIAGILNSSIPNLTNQTVDTVLATTLSQFIAPTFSYTGQDWQDFVSRVKAGNPDLGKKAESRAGAEAQRVASGSFSDALASINQALTTTVVVPAVSPLTVSTPITTATVVPAFTPTNSTNPSGFYTIPTAITLTAATTIPVAFTLNVPVNALDSNNQPTVIPAGTNIPAGSVVPAGIKLPAGLNVPIGITIPSFTAPAGTTLTIGTPFAGVSASVLTLLKNSDDRAFQIPGTEGRKNLSFQIGSQNQSGFSEAGLFKVDDNLGSIAGIKPGENGYLAAVLDRFQVISSVIPTGSLPQGFDGKGTRSLGVNTGDIVRFGVINSSTVEQLRQSPAALSKLTLSEPTTLKVSESNGELSFNWQNSLNFTAKIDSVPNVTLGTSTQGNAQGELLDLRQATTATSATFSIYREAAYNNNVYFYAIQNETGAVLDTVSQKVIQPGDPGYIQAALRNAVADVNLNTANQTASTAKSNLAKGSLFAPIIVVNGDKNALLDTITSNDPAAYTPFVLGNADKVDHVRLLGDNTFGFEDLASGGDGDYNDIIVKINVTPAI